MLVTTSITQERYYLKYTKLQIATLLTENWLLGNNQETSRFNNYLLGIALIIERPSMLLKECTCLAGSLLLTTMY